jgi:CHASE1-domain containing sensor protein
MARRAAGRGFWRHRAAVILLPAAVFAAGLGVTGMLARWRSATDDREAQQRFETLANSAADTVERNLVRYADLLNASAAFQSQNQGQPEQPFRAYVRGLDLQQRFPGLDTITFAPTARPRSWCVPTDRSQAERRMTSLRTARPWRAPAKVSISAASPLAPLPSSAPPRAARRR